MYPDSSDYNIPKEYIEGVMSEINKYQPACKEFFNPTNTEHRYKVMQATKMWAVFHPREGQPEDKNPFCPDFQAWVHEGLLRAKEMGKFFPYRLREEVTT